MPLVLSIIDQRLSYSLFLIFHHPHQQGNILEFKKGLYLSLWVKIKKTKGTLFSRTLKVERNKMSFVFSFFDQGLRYGQSKNLEVFPFDVPFWIMSTLKAALPDWCGQKYLTQCLKYKNGMGLTWEVINPINFAFLCSPSGAQAKYHSRFAKLRIITTKMSWFRTHNKKKSEHPKMNNCFCICQSHNVCEMAVIFKVWCSNVWFSLFICAF